MKKSLRAAKAYLGRQSAVLSDLFQKSVGFPPGVPSARYRADHPEHIDDLDRLESDQIFLARSRDSAKYRVRVYALPLLKKKRAEQLLAVMDALFLEFQEIYRQRLNAQIKLSEIFALANEKLGIGDRDLVREALCYMIDSHGVWSSISNNFPSEDESFISISEHVLRKKSFRSELAQVYDWHIVNPRRTARLRQATLVGASKKKRKNRTKHISKGKSAFLGSSTAVLPEWYDKLKDSQKALIKELDQAINLAQEWLRYPPWDCELFLS